MNTQRSVLSLIALVLLVSPLASVAHAADPARVTLTYDPRAQAAMDPVDAQAVISATMHVTNLAGSPIVLISVFLPAGATLATTQAPVAAPGCAANWGRTTIEYVCDLPTGMPAALPLRLLQGSGLGDGTFKVDLHTLDTADSVLGLSVPIAAAAPTSGYLCQIVIVNDISGTTTYSPFNTLSVFYPTGAKIAVAVFDPDHGAYVDPAAVTGRVVAHALDGSTLAVPLAGTVQLPIAVTAVGPVFGGGASITASAATMWGGATPATFFVRHPGPVTFTASATVGGVDACVEQPYTLAGSALPGAGAASVAATPLVLVPPEGDSDGDGYSNVAELRAGSDPLSYASTPYSDDDHDGKPNGQDLLPLVPN